MTPDSSVLAYASVTVDGRTFLAVGLGDQVLNLSVLGRSETSHVNLDRLLAAGPEIWPEVRGQIADLVAAGDLNPEYLHDAAACSFNMPFTVGDYVDFYSSIHHAENVGRLFRPDEPLMPNWRHLPVGYHGRAGTLCVSGTPIIRPMGQRRGDPGPTYGPCERLDIEAEMGFVVGAPTELGSRVTTAEFEQHVFGMFVVNDWSARDIQAWEYQPLGPFLGKSFATSISPWVVPLPALESVRVPAPKQEPAPLDYLRSVVDWGLDVQIEIRLNGHLVSSPPFASMYWTPDQQLAHMTVNGASLRTGDVYASGTVSGPEPSQLGSFIELTGNGAEAYELADGTVRTFLEDGDIVEISAFITGPNGKTPIGSVIGQILPARL